MPIFTFEEIRDQVKEGNTKKTVALVRAEDPHSLEAVIQVVKDGLLKAIYIGNRIEIQKAALDLGHQIADEDILEAEDPESCAQLGVKLVKSGRADFLMKGKMETAEILRPVVAKETGLSKGGVMSHVAINQIPSYHKLLLTTDGGMLPYPTLEQKIGIIDNAVELMNSLGYERPNVCVIAAVEKVNPKMPETIDADELKKIYADRNEKKCCVEGPISLDLALVKERSLVKGYNSPCAGEADIIVVPNIHVGNALGKSMVELAGARMAGIVLGAECPIVLTSRGSSADEKYYSLILACAIS